MVVKLKEKLEKTRHVKNFGKNKIIVSRKERNVRCYVRIVSERRPNFQMVYELPN